MYKSLAHSSTGTRSGVNTALPPFVGSRFHGLFHCPLGLLFTFPSRYLFTIGHSRIFSLTRWSSQIHTGFHVSHITWEFLIIHKIKKKFNNLQDFHLLWYDIQSFQLFKVYSFIYIKIPQPHKIKTLWFRLVPLRSPLLRESRLLSFPPVTKMFQFTGLSIHCLWIFARISLVVLFGNLRITALTPRSLSLFTPFIVFECLGILLEPFIFLSFGLFWSRDFLAIYIYIYASTILISI